MADLVTYDVADGVAHLELNRPEAANALDINLVSALRTAVDQVADDKDVRSVVVTGAGARFCGGGDVRAFSTAADPASYLRELALEADAALRVLDALPKPVVAGVHGAVAGAGLAIMLSCDVIVADPETKFVFAYPGIGLTPDCGASYLLNRAVGQQRALFFALTDEVLSAETALSWGMVSDVAAEPVQRARDLARSMANGPAHALGRSRQLLRRAGDLDRAAVGQDEAQVIAEMLTGDEARRLTSAFLTR
jgi:2-(1,2-epoxy-1,2-dihydrophenyl)acetyl-CoA isomerase